MEEGFIYRRGMCRHLVLVIDCSSSMLQMEPLPSRIAFVVKQLQVFVKDFFDANPLSELCIMYTKQGTASRASAMSGSMQQHLKALTELPECEGDPSLQNALDLCAAELQCTPAHATREVLMVLSSLTSSDPGDIHESIEKARALSVRLSVIHMSAEVYVARSMCKQTAGIHSVMVDGHHFSQLLLSHVPPSPDVQQRAQVTLVSMGFPTVHGSEGYNCPRCQSWCPHLPSPCPVCALSLVSAAHLARSYHHLFPVPSFSRVPPSSLCSACKAPLATHRCPKCTSLFCAACDSYIHSQIHNCPGCV